MKVDDGLGYADGRADGQGSDVEGDGVGGLPCIGAEGTELAEGGGDVGLVAEAFVDGQGLPVAAFGLGIVTPVMGEQAEVVVAFGDAGRACVAILARRGRRAQRFMSCEDIGQAMMPLPNPCPL